MKLFEKIIILFCLVAALLTGCNSPVYNQAEANVADVVERNNQARALSDAKARPTPPLVINQGLYVDKTPISLQRNPSWLQNQVIFRGDQLPFSYYSRTIANGGGRNILTNYQVGLDQSMMVSINYSGTVKGALDLLAAKTGYSYTVNGCRVYWQAFVTRTFDVAFMPGASDYMMGKTSGGSAAPTGSTGGSGSTNMVVQGTLDNTADNEYSNLKGKLSVWDDLDKAIRQMLSKDGTVFVSQSSTTVTVRDRPSNVNLIARYIASLNHTLSRQVLVKVEVLDVTLSNAFNYGIDWTLIKQTLGQQFTFNGNYGTPISISPVLANTSGVTNGLGYPQLGTVNNKGHETAATILASALTQQGKVSIVTQPRVVCLNNQVSVIRITKQTGYLASLQTTTLGNSSSTTTVNNNTVTSQITPGSVVTGLTLYILPKIMNGRVYLQVNADLSTLDSIANISSTGNGDAATASGTTPLIQVPNVTFKQFNQRALIGSDDTLILAGFKTVRNEANAVQALGSQALGGKGAQEQSTETIVLITPIILPGYA